jgi:hypothetical protein
MKESTKKQKTERTIQDYLSLGYLYLLIIGILREVVFYRFLDINILSYSSVLDVLLSPLEYMAKHPSTVIILIGIAVVAYYFIKIIIYFQKKKQKKIPTSETKKIGIKVDTGNGIIALLAIMIFSFFIGTGIGAGYNSGQKLIAGTHQPTHQLIFIDGDKKEVKLIGNNSQYVFYVLENAKQVSVAPIPGNIKTIDKLLKNK